MNEAELREQLHIHATQAQSRANVTGVEFN